MDGVRVGDSDRSGSDDSLKLVVCSERKNLTSYHLAAGSYPSPSFLQLLNTWWHLRQRWI